MDLSLIVDNLLNAPVLFFLLGAAAAWVKSDLEFPSPIPKLLSLYLLLSIGFRGGVELAHGGLSVGVLTMLGACIAMALLVPLWSFFIVRLRLDAANAAAIAATYGSVSAVTFVTAVNFLRQTNVPFGGHMVAAMALMESPAIVVGIVLARMNDRDNSGPSSFSWGKVFHEAFLNGAVVLLLGSLVIGAITANKDAKSLAAFVEHPFKGVLCLFLLDMGLVAARRMGDLQRSGLFLGLFAVAAPMAHALMGIGLAKLIGASMGDALLLAVLSGSASYIAVPAAVRLSLPKANPGLFVPMALAITFPFNVVLGIPLYLSLIQRWWT